MKKTTLLIVLLIIIILGLSVIVVIQFNSNNKLNNTINLLIDDNFVEAEKYIKNNNLYKNIDYDLLVKKINNQPTTRLDSNSKTGKVIDWYDEYTCKRFINDSNICN